MKYQTKAVLAAAAVLTSSALMAAPAATAAVAAQHCVAVDTPVGAAPSTTPVRCYRTFAEAISAATHGRVQVTAGQRSRPLTDAEMAAPAAMPNGTAATYVLAVDYKDAGFGGSTYTWTSTVTCAQGYSFNQATMPSGWNDTIGSVRTYSGCNQDMYYNANYGQPVYQVVGGSASSLGALNDQTSSERRHP